MKKIVSLVTVLAVFAMLLVGCAGKFDMDKSIEKLKDKGLTEGNIYTTEAELADATVLANSEIKFMGGSFTVEVKGYKQYIQDGDYSKKCSVFHFCNSRTGDIVCRTLYFRTRNRQFLEGRTK